MDTSSSGGHDGRVEAVCPERQGARRARGVPGVRRQTEEKDGSTGLTLEVDGELVALSPEEYAGTGYLTED